MKTALCCILATALAGCGSGANNYGPAADSGAGGEAGGHTGSGGSSPMCTAGTLDCDGNPSNGCEVDPSTDPKHCGKCERDCAGGPCENGACGIGTLAEGTAAGQFRAIALDATDVYFGANRGLANAPSAVVARVPKRGGVAASVADTTDQSIAAVALGVDATAAFFGGSYGPIYRAPKTGGAPTAIIMKSSITGHTLPLDATGVYYTDWWDPYVHGALLRVPKQGGTAQQLATNEPIAAIAADADAIYWLTCAFSVKKQPLGGGMTTTLASLPPSGNCPGYDMPIDGGKLFFAGYYDKTIHAIDTKGGSMPLVNNTIALKLAAGGGVLYWSEEAPGSFSVSGSLWRLNVAGGTPEKIVDAAVTSLAADADAVYWSEDYGTTSSLKVLVR